MPCLLYYSSGGGCFSLLFLVSRLEFTNPETLTGHFMERFSVLAKPVFVGAEIEAQATVLHGARVDCDEECYLIGILVLPVEIILMVMDNRPFAGGFAHELRVVRPDRFAKQLSHKPNDIWVIVFKHAVAAVVPLPSLSAWARLRLHMGTGRAAMHEEAGRCWNLKRWISGSAQLPS